jgi:hypothetical protein
MRSRILTWLFAVLLLGMQQGAQLHALTHLGEELDRPHEQGLQLPADGTSCVVCALYAGGSGVLLSDGAEAPRITASFAAPQIAASSAATSSPTWYLSRAPPTLL